MASVPFRFRNVHEKIDWKKLASVDVEKIVIDLDVHSLQSILGTITFCDIESEIGSPLDPGFVKMFRLAQLLIEYLLHSQECLTSALSRSENLYSKLKQKASSKQLSTKHGTTRRSKHARTLAASTVVADVVDGHQCIHCQKQFINNQYLDMHLLRRHGVHRVATNDAPRADDSKAELLKELRELKDQLASTQIVHPLNSTAKDFENEMQLKQVSDVLFEQLKSVDGKCYSLEKDLKTLQLSAEHKLDVAVTRRINEEAALSLLLQTQKEEMEQLKLQISNLEAGLRIKTSDSIRQVSALISRGIQSNLDDVSTTLANDAELRATTNKQNLEETMRPPIKPKRRNHIFVTPISPN